MTPSSTGRYDAGHMPPRVAFALSGGGSLGAVQVGMIQALYEREIVPDMLVGTSVGALNAAFLATRPPTPDTARELAEIWRRLRRGDVFPAQPLRAFTGLFGARDYLVPNTGLRELLERYVGMRRIEDAVIPLVVVATDLRTGAEIEISSGPAIEAVLGSAAIPGVFPPIVWGDHVLVDGGVANNTPLVPAIASGAEQVYVLPTGSTCELDTLPNNAIGVLMTSMSLLVMRRMILEIEAYQGQARLVVLPPPCPMDTQLVDFDRADELIARGYRDTQRYLDRLDAGEVVAPARLAFHSHG